MDSLHALFLALIQGLTEFLPISSAGHLILFPRLFGWSDQGLGFDVAVHAGSLAAVLVYFRRELAPMARDWARTLRGAPATAESRMAWSVLLGTVPAAVAGLAFVDVVEGRLRGPLVIAAATIGFGLLLWWADRRGARRRDEHSLGWRDVLVVGCAQALALIPGTSRSGITMTAALFLGLTREGAARFSFLLSIPIIALAAGYEFLALVRHGNGLPFGTLLLGAAVSGLSAFACIHYFLKLIERVSMTPFVVYRLALGVVLVGVYL